MRFCKNDSDVGEFISSLQPIMTTIWEKVFCRRKKNLFYPIVPIVLPVFVVVSFETNRMYYFRKVTGVYRSISLCPCIPRNPYAHAPLKIDMEITTEIKKNKRVLLH